MVHLIKKFNELKKIDQSLIENRLKAIYNHPPTDYQDLSTFEVCKAELIVLLQHIIALDEDLEKFQLFLTYLDRVDKLTPNSPENYIKAALDYSKKALEESIVAIEENHNQVDHVCLNNYIVDKCDTDASNILNALSLFHTTTVDSFVIEAKHQLLLNIISEFIKHEKLLLILDTPRFVINEEVRYADTLGDHALGLQTSPKYWPRNLSKHTLEKFGAFLFGTSERPGFRTLDILDLNEQAKILTQVNGSDLNTSMLLAYHQPALVPYLSKMSAPLKLKNQTSILIQIDNQNRNASIITASYSPHMIPVLLKMMANLKFDKHTLILTQVTQEDWNTLIRTAFSSLIGAQYLLKANTGLELNEQYEILKQVNKFGYNALMHAALYQSTAIPPLLKAIAKLELQDQAKILRQIDKNGYNALMLAARYQPDAIPHLLKAITKLELQDQVEILTQAEVKGWNTLMLTLEKNAVAFLHVFNAVDKFGSYEQSEIFMQTNKKGENALMISAQIGAIQAVEFLIKKIDLNLTSPEHATALFFAAQNGQLDIVNFLLQKGAHSTLSALANKANLTKIAEKYPPDVQIRMKNYIDLKSVGGLSRIWITPAEIAFIRGHKEVGLRLKNHINPLFSKKQTFFNSCSTEANPHKAQLNSNNNTITPKGCG